MRKPRRDDFIEDGTVIDYIRLPRPEKIESARRIINYTWEHAREQEVCQHAVPHVLLLQAAADLLRAVDVLQAWREADQERYERTMQRHLHLADDLHEVRTERNRLYAQLMAMREQQKSA